MSAIQITPGIKAVLVTGAEVSLYGNKFGYRAQAMWVNAPGELEGEGYNIISGEYSETPEAALASLENHVAFFIEAI